MMEDQARREVIAHFMEKAESALQSAQREHDAGELSFAKNRIYYACFYAVSAVLLKEKKRFVKHTGVRVALHRDLIHTGELAPDFGKFYDQAFEDRLDADYGSLIPFDSESVSAAIEEAERFVAEMRRLLQNS